MPATGIDPRFRQMGKGARRRRRRVAAMRWAAGLAVAAVAVSVGWWQFRPDLTWLRGGDMRQQLVQVESQFDIAPVVRADTFTDIPGDPLIIPAPDDAGPRELRQVPAPAAVPGRAGGAGGGTVALLDSALVSRDRQLVAMLPSTREEFALFQAERSRARRADPVARPNTPEGVHLAAEQRASSGVVFLRDASLRVPLWRELILETTREVDPARLLAENGFDADTAARLGARIDSQIGIGPDLPSGSVLAMRYRSRGELREVVQLSLYGAGGYVGSLAMNRAGQLVAAADPWADQPLLDELLARQGAGAGAGGQQRLLDLIYSAALRNDVPSETIGEALALMSRVHDLDSHADEADRLTLIYAPAAGPAQPGAILFVGISGPGGDRPCYVIPKGDGFAGHAPSARVQHRHGGVTLTPPVAGVLSQRFVPMGA
ncbi:MAG: hypothetical protein GX805_10155, partial [Gammaproteobacteria bacterium]|nr:hypothetical protein [Gammaproteobacteria bacterium]